MDQHYDYIIAGAGAAGLSLAWKLLQSPLQDKKTLIVDSTLEAENDKTWCFWDAGEPPFSDIIHKMWDRVEVSIHDSSYSQKLESYPYYCLRSIDFREKILDSLRSHHSFELLECTINELGSSEKSARMHAGGQSFTADYIFQSCFAPDEYRTNAPRYPLLQHFVGWEVESSRDVFDERTFTLMDFDETFSDGLAFMYLLPWSGNTCLIEYTVFSDSLLKREKYEEKISIYLNNRFNLKPIDYRIRRKEQGKIPMQDLPEALWYDDKIVNMGTMGGVTKPSTGYTFKRIQDQTDTIMEGLLSGNGPTVKSPSPKRFQAYDLWLLQIIHDHPADALEVFHQLFKRNSVDEIFRFLGEQTDLLQDLKIMKSVPYLPFLRAIWKTMDRLREI